jgi:hypothetical protein
MENTQQGRERVGTDTRGVFTEVERRINTALLFANTPNINE